jgi:hypothetical protein
MIPPRINAEKIMKITDKMRLDWLDRGGKTFTPDTNGIFRVRRVRQWGIREIWKPRLSLRQAIDAAIRASRPSRARKGK